MEFDDWVFYLEKVFGIDLLNFFGFWHEIFLVTWKIGKKKLKKKIEKNWKKKWHEFMWRIKNCVWRNSFWHLFFFRFLFFFWNFFRFFFFEKFFTWKYFFSHEKIKKNFGKKNSFFFSHQKIFFFTSKIKTHIKTNIFAFFLKKKFILPKK